MSFFRPDWITATIKLDNEHDVTARLAQVGWQPSLFLPAKSLNGYRKGYSSSFGGVYFGGDSVGNTLMFQATGSQIDNLESRVGDLNAFIVRLLSLGWSLRRLDMCVEAPYSFLCSCRTAVDLCNFVGSVRQVEVIEKRTSCGEPLGTSLYLGSRRSDRFVRIYDKGAEQGEKSCEYCRIEIVMKNDKIVVSDESLVAVMFSLFKPIVRGGDENKYRCKVMSFYLDFFSLTEAPCKCYRRRSKSDEVASDYFLRILSYVKREVLKYGLRRFGSQIVCNPTSVYFDTEFSVPIDSLRC